MRFTSTESCTATLPRSFACKASCLTCSGACIMQCSARAARHPAVARLAAPRAAAGLQQGAVFRQQQPHLRQLSGQRLPESARWMATSAQRQSLMVRYALYKGHKEAHPFPPPSSSISDVLRLRESASTVRGGEVSVHRIIGLHSSIPAALVLYCTQDTLSLTHACMREELNDFQQSVCIKQVVHASCLRNKPDHTHTRPG